MNIDEIHALLACAMEFPKYYGKNWDAFDECVNNGDTSNPPVKLIVLGWDTFITEHPDGAKKFWSCMHRGLKERKKPTETLVSPRPCPCCAHLTLSDWQSGSYEICEVCNWEDDSVQFADPAYRGGANIESLDEAKSRFEANPKSSSIPKGLL